MLTHNYEVLPASYVTEKLNCTSKDMGYTDATITDSRGSSCTGLIIGHRTLGPVTFQTQISTTASLSTEEMQEKFQLRKDQPKEVLDRLNQKLMKSWPFAAKLHTHTPNWEEVQQKAAIFHKANDDNKPTGDDESDTTEIKRRGDEGSTDETDVRARNFVYAAEGPVSMEEREESNAKKTKARAGAKKAAGLGRGMKRGRGHGLFQLGLGSDSFRMQEIEGDDVSDAGSSLLGASVSEAGFATPAPKKFKGAAAEHEISAQNSALELAMEAANKINLQDQLIGKSQKGARYNAKRVLDRLPPSSKSAATVIGARTTLVDKCVLVSLPNLQKGKDHISPEVRQGQLCIPSCIPSARLESGQPM